jgi:hypothetical protein
VHAEFVRDVSRWNGSNMPDGELAVFAGSGCWNTALWSENPRTPRQLPK